MTLYYLQAQKITSNPNKLEYYINQILKYT
jgi:hypothetical protein